MEQRQLGRSGLLVSRVGLGTMTWGRDTDEYDAEAQLREFLDAGGTLLDTAASYGDGDAERVVGSLVGSVVPRSDVVLATSAGLVRRGGRRLPDPSRRGLLDALDGSLDRLGVDTVDLWSVQVWSDDVPLEETLAALEHAVRSGRARYVGVGGYAGWQLARAVTLAERGGPEGRVVSVQAEYSLVRRDVEAELVPAGQALGAGVLAWSPLGRGVLTGKYRTGIPADSRAASPHFGPYVERYLDEGSRRVVDAVATAAEGLGVAPVEIALAWVRDAPGVASAVVGARTAAQLRGSLVAEELVLPREIRLALDDVSA